MDREEAVELILKLLDEEVFRLIRLLGDDHPYMERYTIKDLSKAQNIVITMLNEVFEDG